MAATALPTANPLATPPADWRQHNAGSYSLWLPLRFEGGQLGAATAVTLTKISNLGPMCAASAPRYRGTDAPPAPVVFVAVDGTRCGGGGLLTTITVGMGRVDKENLREHVEEGVQLIEAVLANNNPQIAWEMIQLGGRESGRMIVDSEHGGVAFRQLQYSFQAGNEYWSVTFTSGDDLDALLPELERVALTFEDSLPDN